MGFKKTKLPLINNKTTMNEDNYQFTMYESMYIHVKLVNAQFATESILISRYLPFTEYRIERAMKKLIKREELYKKYFINQTLT